MLQQYFSLKQQAEDAILFFRMGDFYEIFGDDAVRVAPILNIVLTSRERGDAEKIPFCGVPHHSVKGYWIKLLNEGLRIAIADQVEDPKEAKGLVKRAITKVLSPGLVDDLDGLSSNDSNFIAAVFESSSSRRWAILLADISTGELFLDSCTDLRSALLTLVPYAPRELLARKFLEATIRNQLPEIFCDRCPLFSSLSEVALRTEKKELLSLRPLLNSTHCQQLTKSVPGADLLVHAFFSHLEARFLSVSPFRSIRMLHEQQSMRLDEIARRDLEIFETTRSRKVQGSLFSSINATSTPMGARLLRLYLIKPLYDKTQIELRRSWVRAFFSESAVLINELRPQLQNLPDLERLSARLVTKSASPQELARLRGGLKVAINVMQIFMRTQAWRSLPVASEIEICLTQLSPIIAKLNEALVDHPQALGSGRDVICAAYDQTLSKLSHLLQNGEAEIAQYELQLQKQTGIQSLKIKHHKNFGLLIEVTKANLQKVPAFFQRRQTMVNNERFTTPELSRFSERLANAKDDAIAREAMVYQNLLEELAKHYEDLQKTAHLLAKLDVAQGLATKAVHSKYCDPVIIDNGVDIEIIAGRHPVVEELRGAHQFTANDTLVAQPKRQLLLTGPNMGGKSTYMRQNALIVLLNQIGSFVPAKSARLPLFDAIFTRVGASDDLSKGQSTFLVEMSETATILREATPKSLILIDEVGRGTSTQDGLALASAIFDALIEETGGLTFFATHYHDLIARYETHAHVQLLRACVERQNEKIIFSHKICAGAEPDSFGIEVARLAGLPERVLTMAQEFLDKRGAIPLPMVEGISLKPSQETPPFPGQSQAEIDVIERLHKLNINRLTPIQALNIINDLKGSLTSKPRPKDLFEVSDLFDNH